MQTAYYITHIDSNEINNVSNVYTSLSLDQNTEINNIVLDFIKKQQTV